MFPPELIFDDRVLIRVQWTRPPDDERRMKILVPLSPEDFVTKLKGIPHPSQRATSTWGWYTHVVSEISVMDHSGYLRRQAQTLKSIIDRAKEFSLEEKRRGNWILIQWFAR